MARDDACHRCGKVDARAVWMMDEYTGLRLKVCRKCRVALEKLKGIHPAWTKGKGDEKS